MGLNRGSFLNIDSLRARIPVAGFGDYADVQDSAQSYVYTRNGWQKGSPASEASKFTELSDVPDDYSAQAGQILKVKADGSALEFAPDESGTDEKIKYDAADPAAGYLSNKVIAGSGVSVAEGSGADENKLVITNSDKGSDVDLSGLVPYTGATADVNLADKKILTPEIKTDGVAAADLKITTGAEKTVELQTAVWDDMQVSLGAVRQGSSAATWTPYRGSEVLAFAKNASNKIFFTIQFSHRIKTGTDTEFHIHTVAPDNNAGGVVWSLSVSYANIHDNFEEEGTPTQVTQTIAANSQDKHSIFSIKNPLTANAGISSIALCSLTRLGTEGADDYDNDIYLVALDAHFQIDTMGSRQRVAK